MDPVSRAQQETAVITPHNRGKLRGGHDPSIGRQWPKGVSGNPGGRPKKAPVTELLGEIFDDKACREAIKDNTFKTLTSRGMAGVLLLREAAERLEGKITQPIAVDGEITLALAETVQERRKRLGNGNSEP